MKWIVYTLITLLTFFGIYWLLDYAYAVEPQRHFLVILAVILAYTLGVFNVHYMQYFQKKERY